MSTRYTRNLMQRHRRRGMQRNERMSTLVHRRRALHFLGDVCAASLGAHEDLVFCPFEIVEGDGGLAFASCIDGSL